MSGDVRWCLLLSVGVCWPLLVSLVPWYLSAGQDKVLERRNDALSLALSLALWLDLSLSRSLPLCLCLAVHNSSIGDLVTH